MSQKILHNRVVILYSGRSWMHRHGLHWSYANKRGGPIPVGTPRKWTYLNGVGLTTKWFRGWLIFRRFDGS